MSSPLSAAVATDGELPGALADETTSDGSRGIRVAVGATAETGLPASAPSASASASGVNQDADPTDRDAEPVTRDVEPAGRPGPVFGETARAVCLAVELDVTVAADKRATHRTPPRTPSAAAESADCSPDPLLPHDQVRERRPLLHNRE